MAKKSRKPKYSRIQIDALVDLLLFSKDLKKIGKQFTVWLIGQTENLSRSICVEIPVDFLEKDQIGFGIHNINGCNGTTHITEIFEAMGSDKRFHSHSTEGGGFMIWFSHAIHDEMAKKVPFDLEAIEVIPLEKSWDREQRRG